MLVPKSFDTLRADFDRALLAREEGSARSVLSAMKDQKRMYESMLAVRLDRTLRRWGSALRGSPNGAPKAAQSR